MAYSKYLVRNRHKTNYHFRIQIPVQLRPFFNNRQHLKKTTGTSDRDVALHVAMQLKCYTYNLFTALDNNMIKRKRKSPTKRKLLTTGLVTTPFGDFDYGGDKCEKAAKRELEAANEIYDKMAVNPELATAILNSRSSNKPQMLEKPGKPNTEIFEAIYTKLSFRLSQKSITSRTYNEKLPKIKYWEELMVSTPLATISKETLLEFNNRLYRLPKHIKAKKLTVKSAYELAKSEHNFEYISAKTFNDYILELSYILKYCDKLGVHDSDLSRILDRRDEKKEKARDPLPFSISDMNKIFPSAEYIKVIQKYGKSRPLAAKFWVPLIAFFTGARLEEICQLTHKDIITGESTGIIYFNIRIGETADGEIQRVKNTNSERLVPIHSTLIKIGFLEYLQSTDQKPNDNIYGISRGSQGTYGREMARWFACKDNSRGYIERQLIISCGLDINKLYWSKSFHGMRHTVIDNLRNDKYLSGGAPITNEIAGIVIGHCEEKGETKNYGKQGYGLKLRQDIIEQISYPGVDFDSIKWT